MISNCMIEVTVRCTLPDARLDRLLPFCFPRQPSKSPRLIHDSWQLRWDFGSRHESGGYHLISNTTCGRSPFDLDAMLLPRRCLRSIAAFRRKEHEHPKIETGRCAMLKPQMCAMTLLTGTDPARQEKCIDTICMAPITHKISDRSWRQCHFVGVLERRNLIAFSKDSLEHFDLSMNAVQGFFS